MKLATRKKVRKPMSSVDLKKNLVLLFQNHLGRNNAIGQRDLFTKIYGTPEGFTNLELVAYWQTLKHALIYLRKNSYCFVVSQHNGIEFEYFVIKDKQDAEVYHHHIKNQMEKALAMVQRAYAAANEKYYLKMHGNVMIEGKRKLLV